MVFSTTYVLSVRNIQSNQFHRINKNKGKEKESTFSQKLKQKQGQGDGEGEEQAKNNCIL